MSAPTLVTSADQIVHAAVSDGSTCVVRRDAKVRCWGQFAHGVGRTLDLDVKDVAFVALTLSPNPSQIIALRTDGSLRWWAAADSGDPSPFDGAQYDSQRVSAGPFATCALSKDSIVQCWGTGDAVIGMTTIQPDP